MATADGTSRSEVPLHISLRGSRNGLWEVLCDRMREPLIKVNSREAAFRYAVLLAIAHPPTTIDTAG